MHTHLLTSRGMMMGLLVKGHSLRRDHQLPVAKGTGATVAAAPTWKGLSKHPVVLPCRRNPLDALPCVEEGFTFSVVTQY